MYINDDTMKELNFVEVVCLGMFYSTVNYDYSINIKMYFIFQIKLK
jgi:hypothetical protein